MTGALAERERRALESGDPLTLDEAVSSAWAALSWGAPAACPVCDGRLVPQPDSNAARCRDCGSALY
jgi:DnaJ-class molecular chaperone